jgi:hypothetical protein
LVLSSAVLAESAAALRYATDATLRCIMIRFDQVARDIAQIPHDQSPVDRHPTG